MHASAVIEIEQLRYRWPGQVQDTLNLPELHVRRGEHLFIKGPSGSGKTTLLNLLAGVFTAQSGHLNVLGTELASLSALQRDRFRGDHLGVIFQQFNLLPYLTTLDNILLPLSFSKHRRQQEPDPQHQAQAWLKLLQLPDNILAQPVNRLSIGQQQRVAIARALMGRPELIIADEPTSALDADNRDRFIDWLFAAAEQSGATLVFVSHDAHLAQHFQQEIDLAQLNQASVSEAAS
ncbi:ABC transporter ATP-binding protein [Hydrogenovibrio thermophilus]|uniref:ABC transporter ATP-binding protein n=1 Tax=Hydrogenovibrio thermophilus TaxID=265883 RepID=A0A410H5U7_9GAMM|nr:ABC transporter ATP-binding protein [Hydrogenovibrio thermophilus]QAB16301.1 ABC transporter ATP-binding protein [Hydrogenovibrio thermophilus]